MLALGSLAFVSPWLLVALAALPIIWWLLRVTPPAPRRIAFPAIRLLAEAEREDRQVVLVTTAPSGVDQPAAQLRPVRAADAGAAVQALQPKPWPADRRAALARLEALSLPEASSAVWLSDGVADDGGDQALAAHLVKRGSLRYLTAQPAEAPIMLAAGDAQA